MKSFIHKVPYVGKQMLNEVASVFSIIAATEASPFTNIIKSCYIPPVKANEEH